jgi:CRISPR/Cas system CSM-associated protein Csm3 (group 7 of RAMP superfamily)
LEFSRDAAGQARVPGSSLRGALRARAQRILATMLHQHHAVDAGRAWQAVDGLTTQVFGSTGRAGRLWCDDAIAGDTKEHLQTLIAVDRFTNGVKDGALYTVRAADCNTLSGRAGLSALPPPDGDGWKGLLLLLVRDLLEGELNLGWGRSRGFGQCQLELDWQGRAIGDFTALLDALPDGGPRRWLQALEQDIAGVAATLDRETVA